MVHIAFSGSVQSFSNIENGQKKNNKTTTTTKTSNEKKQKRSVTWVCITIFLWIYTIIMYETLSFFKDCEIFTLWFFRFEGKHFLWIYTIKMYETLSFLKIVKSSLFDFSGLKANIFVWQFVNCCCPVFHKASLWCFWLKPFHFKLKNLIFFWTALFAV